MAKELVVRTNSAFEVIRILHHGGRFRVEGLHSGFAKAAPGIARRTDFFALAG